MVHTFSIWRYPGDGFDRDILESGAGATFVFFQGLWRHRLSVHLLSSSMFLAGGTASVESLQQLWRAVSCAMGYDGSLPILPDLSVISVAVVVKLFLPWPSPAGGDGNVLSDASLGGKPVRRKPGWVRVYF